MMMNMCIILFIMLGIYNWLYQTLCDEMIIIIIVVLAWIQVFIIFKTERDHLHQTEQNKKQKKKNESIIADVCCLEASLSTLTQQQQLDSKKW